MKLLSSPLAADFFQAWNFLTVIPLKKEEAWQNASLARSMVFFPAIGILIGLISLAVYFLLAAVLPSALADWALLLTPMFVTGGLHLDGFIDFCDGFFSGKTKEDTLRIMKDSRVGAFGAAGACVLLLMKLELIHQIPAKPAVFLIALALSRWAQIAVSFLLPYAGENGLGKEVAARVGKRELGGAALWLTPFVFILGFPSFILALGLMGAIALLAFYFKSKIGGVTGDLIGATSELSEILIFALAIMVIR